MPRIRETLFDRQGVLPEDALADRVVNQCVGFPAAKYDDAVDACALIGLALENVHTAHIPWVKKEELLDSWAT